jgi:two-component system cell cycle response regulator CtrA
MTADRRTPPAAGGPGIEVPPGPGLAPAHSPADSPAASRSGPLLARPHGAASRVPAARRGRAAAAPAGRTSRVLLVEDDPVLANRLVEMLEAAGYTVYLTGFGEDALDLSRAYRFDSILLDLSLPDMPGQTVLKRLRLGQSHTPIIILSGESSLSVKLEGFDEGADDYVVKPFHADELLARVAAVIRRARASAPTEIALGALTLDLVTRRALVGESLVPLTGKEYQCLEFLALRRGTTVTKEMFLAHLYGGQDEPEMKIIDVFICKLRRKLADAGCPPLIETVWGRGYTIVSED